MVSKNKNKKRLTSLVKRTQRRLGEVRFTVRRISNRNPRHARIFRRFGRGAKKVMAGLLLTLFFSSAFLLKTPDAVYLKADVLGDAIEASNKSCTENAKGLMTEKTAIENYTFGCTITALPEVCKNFCDSLSPACEKSCEDEYDKGGDKFIKKYGTFDVCINSCKKDKGCASEAACVAENKQSLCDDACDPGEDCPVPQCAGVTLTPGLGSRIWSGVSSVGSSIGGLFGLGGSSDSSSSSSGGGLLSGLGISGSYSDGSTSVDVSIGSGGTTGPALTGPGATQGLQNFSQYYAGNKYGSALGIIVGWTNFVLPFISVIAIAAIVYAGFLYLTAFGSSEQTDKAKKILLWVVIGIILIFSAYAIVNTLLSGQSGAVTSGTGSVGSGSSSTGSASVSIGGVNVDLGF